MSKIQYRQGSRMTVRDNDWANYPTVKYDHTPFYLGKIVLDTFFYGVVLFCIIAMAEYYFGSGFLFAWVKYVFLATIN